MNTVSKLIVVAALLLAAAVAEAQNGALRLIPFQARLTGADGDALPDGNYVVTFRIYDVPAGGTPCWEEVHQSNNQGIVPVVGGQVNVLLGSLTPIDDPNKDGDASDAISFNPTAGISCDPEQQAQMDPPQNCDCQAPGPRYLGITVGGSTVTVPAAEMVPRHQLVPSFHARRADIADAVSNGAIARDMIAANAVDGSKIAPNSVTTEKITDGTIRSSDLSTTVAHRLTSDHIGDGTIRVSHLALESARMLVPTGTIVAWAGTEGSIPPGWYPCDGRALIRAEEPRLFAALGTIYGVDAGQPESFRLPDYRGYFLRNADPNRSVGSHQMDAFQGHTFGDPGAEYRRFRVGATKNSRGDVGGWSDMPDTGIFGANAGYGSTRDAVMISDGVNGPPRIADETRPINIAVIYIIKN